jgi:hypothetical protein
VPQNLCKNRSPETEEPCGKPASIAAIRSGQAVAICAHCALKEYLRSKAFKDIAAPATGRVAGLPLNAQQR